MAGDDLKQAADFEIGQIYKRADLHARYGGQRQGGISTPQGHPFIFLFTGKSGGQYGYSDTWEESVFHYTGEGQSGDMQFKAGNKAIYDHSKNGKALYLFEQATKGHVRFIGQFVLSTYQDRPGKDKDNKDRRIIVFYLRPISSDETVGGLNRGEMKGVSADLGDAELAKLKRRAYEAAANVPQSNAKDSKRRYYERCEAVREYVLARSKGICEACQDPAPFNRKDGTFYLEPHHTHLISESGPDHPRWVGAICPNCHREIHHGSDGKALNERLQQYLSSIETRP